MKKAFTLAEVLITLGIIGVVAALTIPTLIAKHRQKELQAGLQKQYSVLQQSLTRMQQDLGITPAPQEFPRQEFKNKYIKYFNVLLDCGLGSTDITDRDNAKTYCPSEQLNPDEGNRRFTKHYRTFNKTRQIDPTLINNGQFVLNDGSVVMVENWDTGLLYISTDVNGIKRGPNVWGQDLFTFQLMSDGKLLPMGAEGTRYYNQDNSYCSKTSSSNYNGLSCTHKALTDKTFWDNI